MLVLLLSLLLGMWAAVVSFSKTSTGVGSLLGHGSIELDGELEATE